MWLNFSKALFIGVIGALFLQQLIGDNSGNLYFGVVDFFRPFEWGWDKHIESLLEPFSVDIYSFDLPLWVALIAMIFLISLFFLPLIFFFCRTREVVFSSLIMLIPTQANYLQSFHLDSDWFMWNVTFMPLLSWLFFIWIPVLWYFLQSQTRSGGHAERLTGSRLFNALTKACRDHVNRQTLAQIAQRVANPIEYQRMLRRTPDPTWVRIQRGKLIALGIIILLTGLWTADYLIRSSLLFELDISDYYYYLSWLEPLLLLATLLIGLYQGRLWAFRGLVFIALAYVGYVMSFWYELYDISSDLERAATTGLVWICLAAYLGHLIYRKNLSLLEVEQVEAG